MLRWLKNKLIKLIGQELNEYTIRMTPEWQRMVYDEAPKVDTDVVAKAVAAGVVTDLTKDAVFVSKVASAVEKQIDLDYSTLAEQFDLADIAGNLDVSDIAREIDIDTSEIAEQVSNNLDIGDVAGEIDMHDLANEIHMPDLAEAILPKLSSELYTELAARVDISNKLDYQKLAAALLEAVRQEAANV